MKQLPGKNELSVSKEQEGGRCEVKSVCTEGLAGRSWSERALWPESGWVLF